MPSNFFDRNWWKDFVVAILATTVSIVLTFGTGKLPDDELAKKVSKVFDFRPAAIIERLGLRAPIYAQTAAYGHFGRTDVGFSWEKLDYVDKLLAK